MTTTTEAARILLVSKNPSVIETTRSALSKVETLKLIEKEVTVENLFPVITDTQPDVILLDFEFHHHPFELEDKILSDYSMCTIVAILTESKKVNLDRVVLSSARTFIQYPFQSDKLVTTITRVLELVQQDHAYSSSAPGSDAYVISKGTFTVFGPKGGSGCTTIATNLAISLHKTLKEDVLLIDGKHLFGHAALYLNLHTGNSITDLIANVGMLDKRLINQVVVQHTSGIHVLPSPNSIVEAQGIRPEKLFKVIQGLKRVYQYIVIDGGNNLNENTVTYMDSSDKILLVLNPNLASMRDVRQFMEISATLSYPKEKILVILNLTGRKADVQREQIENILKIKVFGEVPADENLALSSLNEGVPILMKKPRHSISRAFFKITKELVKLSVPLNPKISKKNENIGFSKASSK